MDHPLDGNDFLNLAIRKTTKTNDNNFVKSIGTVACREFGFAKLVNAQAVRLTDTSQTQTNSVNGLTCLGNETSIKYCRNAGQGDNTFEISVECSCKFRSEHINLDVTSLEK